MNLLDVGIATNKMINRLLLGNDLASNLKMSMEVDKTKSLRKEMNGNKSTFFSTLFSFKRRTKAESSN